MSDIVENMQQMRSEQDVFLAQENQQDMKMKEKKGQTRKAVADMLKKLCLEFMKGDENLRLIDEGQALSPGYVIMDTQVPSYRALSFAVSAECQVDDVEIMVSDQQWRQVNNFIGNWGNWTDQETVFSGILDEAAIRKKVEHAFLNWYQTVLSRRVAVENDPD